MERIFTANPKVFVKTRLLFLSITREGAVSHVRHWRPAGEVPHCRSPIVRLPPGPSLNLGGIPPSTQHTTINTLPLLTALRFSDHLSRESRKDGVRPSGGSPYGRCCCSRWAQWGYLPPLRQSECFSGRWRRHTPPPEAASGVWVLAELVGMTTRHCDGRCQGIRGLGGPMQRRGRRRGGGSSNMVRPQSCAAATVSG